MEAKVEDVLTQEISKDKNLFGLMYNVHCTYIDENLFDEHIEQV